jgi:hypothetical protein
MPVRDVTDAHYLHVRQGLEAVLRPPVQQPTALAWAPRREELLVADREGVVHLVDPILGTRVVTQEAGEVACLAFHEDGQRWLALGRGGQWLVADLSGQIRARGRHPFLGGMDAFFWRDHPVISGDEVDARSFAVLEGDKIRAKVKVPPRVTPIIDASGHLALARSTEAGLQVIRYDKDSRFPSATPTSHRLRSSGSHVVGLTPTGVCVWSREGGSPQSLRLPELTAGDVFRDGRLLGLGTRTGAVALARLGVRDRGERPDLVKAFDGPITAIAFSQRGRWLATGAEGLQLWSWED